MRPGQQNKRGRGRGGNNNNAGGNVNFSRKGGNPLSRTYDSSGPDVKIRGTAQHIAEKYAALARDAQGGGDRVMAENYLQHAEHYNRIIAAAQAQMQDRYQRDDRGEIHERDGNILDGDDIETVDIDDPGSAAQPAFGRNGAHDGQDQQRREQKPAEERPAAERDNRRRERKESQENQAVEPVAAVAQAPVEAAPVDAGSVPQPVIEGVPAEVAVAEEEQAEGAPRERRRRSAASRPRRPRRSENADGAEAAAPEAAVEVAAE